VELKLPTVAVPVKVALAGRPAVDAEIFVTDVPANRHALLDAVATLLDEDAAFLPVRVAGAIELYAKHAVAWLSVARSPELEELMVYDREHRVEVALAAGEPLRGSVFDSSPAARPRVVDHLNLSGRFIRLWTSAAHVLVNKAQIVRVKEV
jgi:hypothetical protein